MPGGERKISKLLDLAYFFHFRRYSCSESGPPVLSPEMEYSIFERREEENLLGRARASVFGNTSSTPSFTPRGRSGDFGE